MRLVQQIWSRLARALIYALFVGVVTSGAVAQASKTDDPANPPATDTARRAQDDQDRPPNIDGEIVILQGLDKETARIQTFGGKVGSVVTFRTLEIAIRRCQKTPPQLKPERAAFLQIFDIDPETKQRKQVFSGWMFASSPALSAMDHPTYDIWVKDCR